MSKKTRQPQALETIDLGALEAVSGGRTSATAAASKSGTSQRNSAAAPTSASSDPMMALLTQIESSLQAMQQNNGEDPFMKAMLAMQMVNGRGRY